ncbi:MAG: hypothetical protein ACI4Q3_04375 [Kiritimatiellia bacterium]
MRRTILLAACLLLGGASASCLELEERVRREVLAGGLAPGFDDERGTCLAIAGAERVLAVSAGEDAFRQAQALCFRMAELRARHQIMDALGMGAQGSTAAGRVSAGDRVAKSVETVFSTFSQSPIVGCERIAFRAERKKDRLAVAVALKWSRALEWQERRSAEGTIAPAPGWQAEFRARFAVAPDAVLPPTLLFVDSAGFVHHVGVGTSLASDASALRTRAALTGAELRARGNFQLLLFGDAAVRKHVQAQLASGREGLEAYRTVSSAFAALGRVSASGALPAGSCEIHLARVPLPDGTGTLWVSFYGL